jgi:2-polyprenyl-3-methyl-5-hydroxy-6-metoxy-1,4-benzoquinol methylase
MRAIMTSWMHEERLQAVEALVRDSGATRVLDLGCGDGDLFVRLACDPRLSELVGMDVCRASLLRLRTRLAGCTPCVPHIDLRTASMTDPAPDLAGFDCAVLVETIEHIAPDRLSALERALFRTMRPRTVVITTPNAEFNPLLGVPRHRMRHPGHRFEWDRTTFRRWCMRVADATGYVASTHDIAGQHPDHGGASQMAVFRQVEAKAPLPLRRAREQGGPATSGRD